MKRYLSQLLAALAVAVVACSLSCRKNGADKLIEEKNATFKSVNAKIVNTGAVAADGCDYTVVIDNTHYHPDNLSSEFAVNDLNVVVSANLTDARFRCGFTLQTNPGMPVIHIVKITKQ